MIITEDELADFLYNVSMEQGNKTITRDDARRFAIVMVAAARTTEHILAEARKGW